MKERLRFLFTCLAAVLMAAMTSVTAFASAATPLDVNSILGTAFGEAVNSIIGSIGVILPIALPVLGISIAIGFSINLFRKLTGKASQ